MGPLRLEEWSGLTACTAAKRTLVPRRLGGILQRRDPRRFRSGVTGQANAILLAPVHVTLEHRTVRISERGRERRVCHAVRLEGIVIGNVHASNEFSAGGATGRAEARARAGRLDGRGRRAACSRATSTCATPTCPARTSTTSSSPESTTDRSRCGPTNAACTMAPCSPTTLPSR